jgi:hypothetical protein
VTFEEFCQKELGKSRQHVYRLIEGYDMLMELTEMGFDENELPQSRTDLARVEAAGPGDQGKVWEQIRKQVIQTGKKPTIHDVQAVARAKNRFAAAISRRSL